MNRTEFENTLNNPIEFWGVKTKQEVKKLLGYDVAQMVGYDQRNPHHCYDLWFHTLHTVEAVGVDAPTALKVAAFFHDIGKPQVAREKEGRLVFYNHAEKSIFIAAPILEKIGYGQNEIIEILFYILYHDAFISWDYREKNPYAVAITGENVRKFIEEKRRDKKIRLLEEMVPTLWKNLFCLCRADAAAQAKSGILNGKSIATSEEKQAKIARIRELFYEAGYITP